MESREDDAYEDGSQDSMYLWRGYQDVSPHAFPCFKSPVSRVSIGLQHCGFVTSAGQLYMYGSNSHGQLGLPNDDSDFENEPQLVEALSGKSVVDVSCGARHTVALTSDGCVFCWGDNTYGQCGVPIDDLNSARDSSAPSSTHSSRSSSRSSSPNKSAAQKKVLPCQVPLRDSSPPCHHGTKNDKHVWIIQVAAGEQHTLVLSEYGELWTWGTGIQLGLTNNTVFSVPTKIEFMVGRQVLSIACGARHCLALVQKLDSHSSLSRTTRSSSLESDKSGTATSGGKDLTDGCATAPRYRPATCAKCKVEMYDVSEEKEFMESYKKCPLGLDVNSKDEKISANYHTSNLSVNNSSSVVSLPAQFNNSSTVNPTPMGNGSCSSASLPSSKLNGANSSTSLIVDISNEKESNQSKNVVNEGALSTDILEMNEFDRSPNLDFTEDVDQEDKGIEISSNVDFHAVADAMVEPDEDSSLTNSTASLKGVARSRSIFLQDETEAKEYLEKQFMEESSGSMTNPAAGSGGGQNGYGATPPSPLVKTVENFLSSYVPTQQAAAMQDIAKLQDGDFVRYGTLPKSTSVGALKQQKTHHRKGSLPSGAIILDTIKDVRNPFEIVLDTEVWSWGHGKKGQLGHGDQLDRSQPTSIKMFREAKVQAVCAGAYHSLVLMASSHVYVWGQQALGKLGHSDPMSATPCCIKVAGGSPIWDIAAGNDHSIVLSDNAGFCPDIHYTGRQPNSENSTTLLTRINALRKTGYTRQIFGGGSLCAHIADHPTSFITSLHQFASTERSFHVSLDQIARKIIKPLISSESFRAIESSQMGVTMQMLCSSFIHLTDSVAVTHLELRQVCRRKRSVLQLRLIAKADKVKATFQHYVKCLCDVIVIGAIEYTVHAASGFWDKIKDQVVHAAYNLRLLPADGPPPPKLDDTVFTRMLSGMLLAPLERISEYHKALVKLASSYSTYSGEHRQLTQVSCSWESLKNKSKQEITSANTTKDHWDTCSAKVLEALRTPKRRMLRNSKANPLCVFGAGRFSSHTFILFNDMFVHLQYSNIQQYHLQTIWVDAKQDAKEHSNCIKLTMPEDSLLLTAPSSSEKSDWLWALNEAIGNYLNEQKHIRGQKCGSLTPPRDRHASHVFYKVIGGLKDASYTGMWRNSKMHGHGELTWADGKKYHGQFRDGMQNGFGSLTIPKADGVEEQEGYWEQGKLQGLGTIRYTNGSVYKGYFHEGKRHGHGVLQQGKHTSSSACIYIGQWQGDKRNGYGVLDDISKGEQYMGFWQDDQRHGNGVIVTLQGMYFEGSFTQGKMTGYGLLMTADDSYYEGEFAGGPYLSGRGTLTLPNGDYIEGSFNGSFDDGIKVNGTFRKAQENHGESNVSALPKSFGRLSVPAGRKWEDLFDTCCVTLGCSEKSYDVNSRRAWERVASVVSVGKKNASDESLPMEARCRAQNIPDELETIPNFTVGKLTIEHFNNIKSYLEKACELSVHPVGALVAGLVDVFWATYVGVGAQPRLLPHAVSEVRAATDRLHPIIRILFPDLPATSEAVDIYPSDYVDDGNCNNDSLCLTVTPASLLYPLILPKIYPPLFTLYGLYNEKEDEKYWKRVCLWNKQPDLALMSYLGVKEMFWLIKDSEALVECGQRLTAVKDQCYVNAVDTLQRISTLFLPNDKIALIRATFSEITKVVQEEIESNYQWNMDELLPVFQYVVVRSRIQHLGAEIHFIDDLMEQHLEFGELSLMFTTLKACYFQIQNEKIT